MSYEMSDLTELQRLLNEAQLDRAENQPSTAEPEDEQINENKYKRHWTGHHGDQDGATKPKVANMTEDAGEDGSSASTNDNDGQRRGSSSEVAMVDEELSMEELSNKYDAFNPRDPLRGAPTRAYAPAAPNNSPNEQHLDDRQDQVRKRTNTF